MPPRAINFLFTATHCQPCWQQFHLQKNLMNIFMQRATIQFHSWTNLLLLYLLLKKSRTAFLPLNPNPCLRPEICWRLGILFMIFTIPSMKKSTLILGYSAAFLRTQNKYTVFNTMYAKYQSQWPPYLMTKKVWTFNHETGLAGFYLFTSSLNLMFKMLPF